MPGSDLLTRAAEIASDHDAGASELTARLLSLLADALGVGHEPALDIARIVLAEKPAMASLWHASAAATAERQQPGTFARRRAEMERAPRALRRAAAFALRDLLAGESAPVIVTLSYSSSVSGVLQAVAESRSLRVVCGEGRPRYEGRRLAAALAARGVDVTLTTDAALTTQLDYASAIVSGADAVTGEFWINKVGSFGLAAAAARRGTPFYVIAGRDKFLPRLVLRHLTSPEGPSGEVWPDGPAHIRLANPYFEATPDDLVTLFLTDVGPVAAGDAAAVAEAHARDFTSLLKAIS